MTICSTVDMKHADRQNLVGKGEGKIVPVLFLAEHHAMKAYWRSGGIAPRII
jgi:hypothetical protein